MQRKATQLEKSYAIVPTRNAHGTFRRPIYIECRGDKLIIQPEGIELVPGDFQALDRPDNPFDTALRTIRQYYIETEQVVRGSEPYPLLIVRPSGVEMYENARQATGNWVKDFGYEIVNEDWHIQYPESNDDLRARVQQQLDIARNRLSGYLIAMHRQEAAEGRAVERDSESRLEGRANNESGTDHGAVSGPMPSSPQQFRMDHRGNVVPVYATPTTATARQGTADGRRQTVTDHVSEQDSELRLEGRANNESGTDRGVVSGVPQPQQRPLNWALQGATQYTTGISRSVRVRCESDRFVLLPQSGLESDVEIPIDADSVVSSADRLVEAIWEFQRSWGVAGENTHWRPILNVRVSPGGEQRLEELRSHLRHSGLVIEE
jgi:hypothetical protein